MQNQTVTFGVDANIRDRADTNAQGFDSIPSEEKPNMQPYKIPPIVWVFVLLIGGYLGIRYVMED